MKKKKKSGTLGTILFLVVLVALIFGCFFLAQKKSKERAEEQAQIEAQQTEAEKLIAKKDKKYEMPSATSVNITNQSQFTAYYSIFSYADSFEGFYGNDNSNYHYLTLYNTNKNGALQYLLYSNYVLIRYKCLHGDINYTVMPMELYRQSCTGHIEMEEF